MFYRLAQCPASLSGDVPPPVIGSRSIIRYASVETKTAQYSIIQLPDTEEV